MIQLCLLWSWPKGVEVFPIVFLLFFLDRVLALIMYIATLNDPDI